jgi:choline dehydrogenase-like flavoprotein
MRQYRDEVDFAIVGTGVDGGTLACKVAEAGFSVVALDAGPFRRPLEDFASDETEQIKLCWSDETHRRRRESSDPQLFRVKTRSTIEP